MNALPCHTSDTHAIIKNISSQGMSSKTSKDIYKKNPRCFAVGMFSDLLHTVFTRLNAAAFIKFLAFPMRRLFEGGVYFKIISHWEEACCTGKVLGVNHGTAHCKNSEEKA